MAHNANNAKRWTQGYTQLRPRIRQGPYYGHVAPQGRDWLAPDRKRSRTGPAPHRGAFVDVSENCLIEVSLPLDVLVGLESRRILGPMYNDLDLREWQQGAPGVVLDPPPVRTLGHVLYVHKTGS